MNVVIVLFARESTVHAESESRRRLVRRAVFPFALFFGVRVVRTHTYVSHPVRALSSATYLLPYPYSVSALTYTPVALDGESNERTHSSLYTVRSSPTRAMRPRAHARLTASDAVASMSIDRANVRARCAEV